MDQNFQKEREEIEIFLGRRQRKRVDLEILGFQAHAHVGTAEELRKTLKAAAQVEDEGVGIVFLEIGNQEIQEKRFSRARAPENHGVGDVAVMEVQEVRGVVIGFEDREIFRAEMIIAPLATVEGKEKREIRIVRVEQIQETQVEGVVAGNGREESIQEVVFFLVELSVVDAEDFVEVGARPVHLRHVEVVDHNGERKLSEVVAVQLDLLDAFAEFPNLGFLGVVEKHVLGGQRRSS